ncbi:UTP--glucose-1-phosphate uridylyltransferase [Candidatus Uhrbacteria bacterium RIFOXYC2_FULL_47_19]|uniref:UTP--glucose-1-phosphate uridylyltransferase n=1 Tax=Candidatus Uhrbacteria bacterium RIFOXYC2_FULL_47_19 TaxID=1802424 RepID=A0A1F7WEN9_9BACT|nr:MAG: UTP--glucose-1-phosphate uridylyltransferase [Candidatus Uhrbacteria bacterium RIFOXYC2_FULL_47_19]
MKIRKAIIPVAGMGTRFLPATKAQPKEMLALVDKPIIQYIVEEAVAAGIEQIIFVTSSSKRSIEDHFDTNFELEYRLKEKGKLKELKSVQDISNLASFVFVRQKEPRGDGHAILQAKDLISDEPCAVMFGEEIVDSDKPCIGQLMKVYEKYDAPVIAVERMPQEDLHCYGVIDGKKIEERTHKMTAFVEKPEPGEAPTDLIFTGKAVITPEVMKILENAPAGKDGEIRLADAFQQLLKKKGDLYAYEFEGRRYDCGNKTQFLIASVDYGLKDPEVNKNNRFTEYIKKRAAELD